MPKLSAGIVLYRWGKRDATEREEERSGDRLEIFLVHPGGPFWAKKDAGAWSIPKGEYVAGEEPLAAARREFAEETGFALPQGEPTLLGEVKQAGGKIVTAWALEGDCAADNIKSNLFSMEWPPRSGRMQEFPEVDRAAWLGVEEAKGKLLAGQREFLDRFGEVGAEGALKNLTSIIQTCRIQTCPNPDLPNPELSNPDPSNPDQGDSSSNAL